MNLNGQCVIKAKWHDWKENKELACIVSGDIINVKVSLYETKIKALKPHNQYT